MKATPQELSEAVTRWAKQDYVEPWMRPTDAELLADAYLELVNTTMEEALKTVVKADQAMTRRFLERLEGHPGCLEVVDDDPEVTE